MVVRPAPGRLQPISTRGTVAVIADQLRESIADGTFAPGTQITEVFLASELGVSRGPVREAVQRLVQEGLLRSQRNRGISVPALSRDEVDDIYRARGAIEAAAVELLIDSDGGVCDELDGLLDELDQAYQRHEYSRTSALDLAFHQRLVQSSSSVRLARAFDTLVVETRMCLTALEATYGVRPDIADLHRQIVAAVRHRDPELARSAIRHHNLTAVQDLFDQSP